MVRIKDIANQLGVSPTTVSNVIHGKTKRVSQDTIQRVNEALAKAHYVPNMGGVLLSQNNSMIIAVILNNDIRYENKILQNPFIVEMISALEENIRSAGYFTMLHNANSISEVARIATMWNVSGIILFGFGEDDYARLRQKTKTPFISIDATFENQEQHNVNVGIDDFGGAYSMGKCLISKGHKNILFIADNDRGCDKARRLGLIKALEDEGLDFPEENHRIIPSMYYSRMDYYSVFYDEIRKGCNYTAMFFASDFYAIEAMNYLQDHGIQIPRDMSIAGFDDVTYATIARPCLTTVRQNLPLKAATAVNAMLNIIRKYPLSSNTVRLPLEIVERDSVGVPRQQ